jgi:hypothetical protein
VGPDVMCGFNAPPKILLCFALIAGSGLNACSATSATENKNLIESRQLISYSAASESTDNQEYCSLTPSIFTQATATLHTNFYRKPSYYELIKRGKGTIVVVSQSDHMLVFKTCDEEVDSKDYFKIPITSIKSIYIDQDWLFIKLNDYSKILSLQFQDLNNSTKIYKNIKINSERHYKIYELNSDAPVTLSYSGRKPNVFVAIEGDNYTSDQIGKSALHGASSATKEVLTDPSLYGYLAIPAAGPILVGLTILVTPFIGAGVGIAQGDFNEKHDIKIEEIHGTKLEKYVLENTYQKYLYESILEQAGGYLIREDNEQCIVNAYGKEYKNCLNESMRQGTLFTALLNDISFVLHVDAKDYEQKMNKVNGKLFYTQNIIIYDNLTHERLKNMTLRLGLGEYSIEDVSTSDSVKKVTLKITNEVPLKLTQEINNDLRKSYMPQAMMYIDSESNANAVMIDRTQSDEALCKVAKIPCEMDLVTTYFLPTFSDFESSTTGPKRSEMPK